ncbi:MAG TPA: biotin--[acetyl-CoA-carboxylase] ligase [Gemmatimonadaceae bacterium]|nr:biotin--[acetyl-CoA-carboxylase] ligase [Gemmatimonadaceae bacterium]
MAESLVADRYAGASAATIAARCGVPRVVLFDAVTSTLDVAHPLARDGAPEGTLILSERQTAGRGRSGRAWASEEGAGIWLTLIARPADDAALEVLSLRVGLGAARALEAFTDFEVRVKWPNDLMLDDGKLGGILIESRWREERVDWVAIGIGINCRVPHDILNARALRPDVNRIDVLASLIPAVRTAAAARGALAAPELHEFERRDWALGRRCIAPVAGIVRGIDARGALLVRTNAGEVAARSGSLLLEEDS